MDNVKRSGKTKHHQDRFGLGSIARKGHAATCRAKNQIGFLLFSFRASVDKANGPMSGPHPYTDGVSLTSPTPQSCTATAKTTGTTDLSAWPTLRAVDRPNVTVKRALAPCGVGEVNPKGHRSGFPGLSYAWKGNGMELIASGENRAIKRLEAEVLKLGRMCDERGSNEARPTSGRKKAEGQSMKPEIIQAILGGEVISEPEELTVTGTEARVCEMIASRQKFGLNKYGVSVEANPLKAIEWLQHLREELADALVYATRLQEEMQKNLDDGK